MPTFDGGFLNATTVRPVVMFAGTLRHNTCVLKKIAKVRSHKKRDGTAVTAHNRVVNVKDDTEAGVTVGPSPKSLLNEKPSFVFPDPRHVPPPLSFMKRIIRNASTEKYEKRVFRR